MKGQADSDGWEHSVSGGGGGAWLTVPGQYHYNHYGYHHHHQHHNCGSVLHTHRLFTHYPNTWTTYSIWLTLSITKLSMIALANMNNQGTFCIYVKGNNKIKITLSMLFLNKMKKKSRVHIYSPFENYCQQNSEHCRTFFNTKWCTCVSKYKYA